MHGLPCFDLMAASIRKSGLEIENQCMDCHRFNFFAASIRKFGLEIKNRCTDCPCFDLMAASIRKSGLEIENQCTDCPCFDLFAAAIANSGPEIRNHCSAIVPARRIARLRRRCRNGAASDSNFLCRKVLQFRLLKPVVAVLNGPPAAFVAALMNGPPAALWLSQGRIARLLLYRCRRDERPACRMTVAGAGRDRLPRRRHNPK